MSTARSPRDHVERILEESDGGRGMGSIQPLALLPTLDEIEKGSINHALNMETFGTMFGPACPTSGGGTPGVDCGYAVAPATKLEWWNGTSSMCGSIAQQNTAADRANGARGHAVRHQPHRRSDRRLADPPGLHGSEAHPRPDLRRRPPRLRLDHLRHHVLGFGDQDREGVTNPKARARWAQLGITNPASDGGSLLSGLITSESQVTTLEAPQSALVLTAW